MYKLNLKGSCMLTEVLWHISVFWKSKIRKTVVNSLFFSHFPAPPDLPLQIFVICFLSRCQIWKWLFVSRCSQMVDESLLWSVKFFFFIFFTQMSVNKTDAELQWHIMCYSQETLICGSGNNEWKLQHVQWVILIISCDLKKRLSKTRLRKRRTRAGKPRFSSRSTKHCF